MDVTRTIQTAVALRRPAAVPTGGDPVEAPRGVAAAGRDGDTCR